VEPLKKRPIFSESKITVSEVKDLYSFVLKNYLKDDRHISLDLAGKYLKEVHYKVDGSSSQYFALGFSVGEAYVLRNKRINRVA